MHPDFQIFNDDNRKLNCRHKCLWSRKRTIAKADYATPPTACTPQYLHENRDMWLVQKGPFGTSFSIVLGLLLRTRQIKQDANGVIY